MPDTITAPATTTDPLAYIPPSALPAHTRAAAERLAAALDTAGVTGAAVTATPGPLLTVARADTITRLPWTRRALGPVINTLDRPRLWVEIGTAHGVAGPGRGSVLWASTVAAPRWTTAERTALADRFTTALGAGGIVVDHRHTIELTSTSAHGVTIALAPRAAAARFVGPRFITDMLATLPAAGLVLACPAFAEGTPTDPLAGIVPNPTAALDDPVAYLMSGAALCVFAHP